MQVWSYVIVVDDGGAPNFERPATTLAICKPSIRRKAKVGDLVIAFTGQSLCWEPHAVRWAGIVAESLPFKDYWDDPRFQNKKPNVARTKPDNIYYPKGSELLQIKNEKHGPKNVTTDLRGERVLIFKPSWKFNYTSPDAVLPEKFGLRITGVRRGHRKRTISPAQWCELKAWLDSAPRDRQVQNLSGRDC